MEERILKYVTKSTKAERFERKYQSWWSSTFDNEQYGLGRMPNGASRWEDAR